MQNNVPTGLTLRRTAGADLSAKQDFIVMLDSSDEIQLHDGSFKTPYLLLEDAADGKEAAIQALDPGTPCRVKSAGAHTIHAPVFLDAATGKATATVGGVLLGFCLETKSSGEGNVLIRPCVGVARERAATLAAGATPSFAPGAVINLYTLTPAENETIAGVTTGAIPGKRYGLKVLTSGTTSYTLTFGANFKSTGTLATGTTDAKTFMVEFVFDGTNFVEVSRTTAM